MIIEQNTYDGDLIHRRFAYTYFKKRTLPIGNIVTFRSPMLVEADGMIDHEDVLKNDFIYSDDAINFCWEIPGLDSFGAVAWQRLFNTSLANILQPMIQAPIEVDGDDLIVHKEFTRGGIVQPKGKCSVSITYTKDGAGPDVEQESTGIAIAYTMGGATLAIQNNSMDNVTGTAGTNDEITEVSLSMAF